MTKSNSVKRSLIASIVSVSVCVLMALGTTFAWFTDSAKTAVNKIQAGELKVDIVNESGTESVQNTGLKFKNADGISGETLLWEPGCTYKTEGFKIKNNGNLALKYKLALNGITGDSDLLKVISFSVVKEDGSAVDLSTFEGKLNTKNELSEVLFIQGHMAESASNFYQGKELSGLGLTVVATQNTYEKDSKDNLYDKFAEYEDIKTVSVPAGDQDTVNSALKSAITAAKTVDSSTGKTTPTQIVLPSNTTVSFDSGIATPAQGQTSEIKITGDKTTKLKFQNTNPGSEGSLCYQDGANLTFQGITIDAGSIKGICARGGVVTFIDCELNTELKQTIGSKFVFKGCTFTSPVSQVGYGCKDVVFDGCKFNTEGYGIKIYSEGSTPVNLTVKNSEFKNTSSAAKSAIFLDHIIGGISYNISVENCTFDGFTATPTENFNQRAARMIVTDSFVLSSDGQYIFSYQTGVEGGNYHKILSADQLVVTVK